MKAMTLAEWNGILHGLLLTTSEQDARIAEALAQREQLLAASKEGAIYLAAALHDGFRYEAERGHAREALRLMHVAIGNAES